MKMFISPIIAIFLFIVNELVIIALDMPPVEYYIRLIYLTGICYIIDENDRKKAMK